MFLGEETALRSSGSGGGGSGGGRGRNGSIGDWACLIGVWLVNCDFTIAGLGCEPSDPLSIEECRQHSEQSSLWRQQPSQSDGIASNSKNDGVWPCVESLEEDDIASTFSKVERVWPPVESPKIDCERDLGGGGGMSEEWSVGWWGCRNSRGSSSLEKEEGGIMCLGLWSWEDSRWGWLVSPISESGSTRDNTPDDDYTTTWSQLTKILVGNESRMNIQVLTWLESGISIISCLIRDRFLQELSCTGAGHLLFADSCWAWRCWLGVGELTLDRDSDSTVDS